MASTLKAAVDAMCIVPGDAMQQAFPADRNPLMHAVDATLQRMHIGDAGMTAAGAPAAGAPTRWMAMHAAPAAADVMHAAWARATPSAAAAHAQPLAGPIAYPHPPLHGMTALAYGAMGLNHAIMYQPVHAPPLAHFAPPAPIPAHTLTTGARHTAPGPSAAAEAADAASIRRHAADIVKSMEAMAAGDARFASSSLLSFMRDVREGEVYPHALGRDTPPAEEIARRVRALEELWRDALGGAELPAVGGGPDDADIHGLWGAARTAAATGAADDFNSYWGRATAELNARVDATPAARAAEEERLRALIDRAWDVANGGATHGSSAAAAASAASAELESAATWEEDDSAALFAEEGGRAAAVLEAMAAGQALDGGPTRPYTLRDVAHNAIIAREMRAAAAGVDETPDTRAARLFEEGVQAFRDGRILHAVEVFEAVLAGDAEHSEAWRMLGVCHAELDDDRAAIACLERSVDADAYNLNALLALGVSCVNERDRQRALTTLRAWVTHHPRLHAVEALHDAYSDASLTDEVLALMHAASNALPGDADVATVLGVLYNAAEEYGAAEEAFREALRDGHDAGVAPGVRDVHSLWNRLGATQSLSGRHRDALHSYAQALRMKPTFARGWLNAGIAYFNLADYARAAACYLHTLRLAPSAGHVWALLRVVFNRMGRLDLLARTEACNVDAFGDEFEPPDMEAAAAGAAQ